MNMNLLEKELLFLPVFVIIALPFYVQYRRKIKLQNQKSAGSSGWGAAKIAFLHFFPTMIVVSYFLVVFATIMANSPNLDPFALALSIFFLTLISLTLYGNGIYIATIIIEESTPKLPKFSPSESLVVLRGPLSHLLIHSGWLGCGLVIALLGMRSPPPAQLTPPGS